MGTQVFVGRQRNVVTHAVVSLLTLGLYSFIWLFLVGSDLRRHRQAGADGAVLLVLFLLVPVIGWFLAPFLAGRQVRAVQESADADHRSSAWYPGLWGLVPVVGWTIAVGLVQSGANRAWDRLHRDLSRGTTAPVMLECPQCTDRFERLLNPFAATPVVCPKCGNAGAV